MLRDPASRLPLEVAVSCSTSNLGPGFDLAGLALGLYLRAAVVRVHDGPHRLEVQGAAASDWPLGEDNLLLRALKRFEQHSARPLPGLDIAVHSDIPVARGLGSSGAAIVAGLLLARELTQANWTRDALIQIGIELEGHPDNVAAALCGGLTLCLPGQPPLVIEERVHPSLAFALAWPERKLATPQARAALPEQVAFRAAVGNARRLPILLEGLRSGRADWIRRGGIDELHVPYRLPLIPGGAAALAAAERRGAYLATISGAGSALLAICAPSAAQPIADAMAAELAQHGAAEARVLPVAVGAPCTVNH